MTARLTDKQLAVLRFIAEHIAGKGYAPSTDEIAAHFGWASSNSAYEHIECLLTKRAIERPRGKRRALCVTADGHKLLGAVAHVPTPHLIALPVIDQARFGGAV
ncbi:MAG: hypothetical protein V4669_13855 [Pseudomonadota bacterium]